MATIKVTSDGCRYAKCDICGWEEWDDFIFNAIKINNKYYDICERCLMNEEYFIEEDDGIETIYHATEEALRRLIETTKR